MSRGEGKVLHSLNYFTENLFGKLQNTRENERQEGEGATIKRSILAKSCPLRSMCLFTGLRSGLAQGLEGLD